MINKNKELSSRIIFNNEVINKKKLQRLMSLTFDNYGVTKSSLIADRVKNLTFHYATMSGISLSVEDLRVPFRKRNLIGMTNDEVDITEENYQSGNITTVERFQKVIDIWNNANNSLKEDVLTYFRESDPLNPLYIMAFSGARGNISQVRQLVGMRGLMADPQGQIIDLPIKSNFREGLKVTEYIISSYGARKGLVDTALRTADSGYLTRRLVDVAQDIIVREEDCLTKEGLSFEDLFKKYKTDSTFKERLIGRLLLKAVTVHNGTETLNWSANTEIDNFIATKFLDLGVDNLEVRSPLTCNALRSICRKCYGWHLSYSKVVDLGEAVGILAAQSIGEPGTQLTMRTFHTGGVFSGDLTKQIRAPFAGTISYKLLLPNKIVRTIHGEKGFSLVENVTLLIENTNKTICSLDIPPDALLLANNGQKVYPNQVIAEIKKDANLILEEERSDIFTELSGEVFFQNIKISKSADGENATKEISKTTGLIWVLQGNRSIFPSSADLRIKIGQTFTKNKILADQKFYNSYPGTIQFGDDVLNEGIKVINSSMALENATVTEIAGQNDILKLSTLPTEKIFQLHVKKGDILNHGQTIASLKDDAYQTETGGVVYYSINTQKNKKKRKIRKLFTGFLYWLPEETHSLNSTDQELLNLKEGEFIEKGTVLLPNVSSNLSGIIHFDNSNSELIIKPGELYKLNDQVSLFDKTNRFIEEGKIIFSKTKTIIVQTLSYLEFLNFSGAEYVLIRPVKKYKIPHDKGFVMQHRFFPSTKKRGIAFRTVKRIFYKDGEKVKSNNGGVELLKTFLVLELKTHASNLKAHVEYVPLETTGNSTQYRLKLNLAETIRLGDHITKDLKTDSTIFLKYLAQNNQYVKANTILAKAEILAHSSGTLVGFGKTNTNTAVLILKERDFRVCTYDPSNKSEPLLVNVGDLVRIGTLLTRNMKSKYAGQIYKIENEQIHIRLGRPYLISEGTVLRAGLGSLVEKSDLLATLVYDKLKTVDIVQGLPKVEEILEARKIKNGCILALHEGKAFKKENCIEILTPDDSLMKIDVDPQVKVNFTNGKFVQFLEPLTDGQISPHDKLEILFNYYQLKNPVHLACKKSFKNLQLFLVSEVQRTYFSQGVQIADKHIEIIVKQMTSKVRVYSGGDTTLLPGEILDINQAELITKAAILAGEEPPEYRPMLLGLTKASLNSDSFISAASFQETTRVLTEAAIEGKKDWLNGLKENVIIGRLIPAGTGFNCFENLKKTGKETFTNLLIRPSKDDKIKSFILKSRAD
jgi:DNA-directed RNA polymerase subunit beta'